MTREFFHLTEARNVTSILENGLLAKIGPRSLASGEAQPAVYGFGNLLDLEQALLGWASDTFDEEEDLVVIQADIEGLTVVSATPWELAVTAHIGTDRILRVATLDELFPPVRKAVPVVGSVSS